ncbi:MAG TPA: rod shape-determining protein MreD [Sphingomonas sp.]|jgi:rod shape-determining protein MreD|uniref:rod shape-determining protein MreD n=1 Tax=Sphingomonas sp. TaxID=28214 RepID=UPI002EDAB772
MSDALDYRPFAPVLPPARARALPWATVLGASALTAVPVVATLPLLPPLGLLMLLTWRLLARFALRRWAAAPLGFFDDLVSGQPLGSAVLAWSLCFLVIDLVEQRFPDRDFGQDWLIAAGLVAATLLLGRLVAAPLAAPVAPVLAVQIAVSVLLFPLFVRIVAWIDRRRGQSEG